jgi:lipopolysaccharide/colanic/teichoic acid biosynthesis glycosyltransferase
MQVKSVLDYGGGALLWFLFSPLIIVLSLMIMLLIGRPIFFRQTRPGLKGRPFCIVKFRTMADTRDSSGNLLPDEKRITKFGLILRTASLDELPELYNVLKGEMSLVGPRPLLMEYLSRYTPEQARRHDVKPGITGWAQIGGRNAITWEKKFAMDVWYVQNQSFRLDLKILAKTLIQALRREGISQPGHVTAEKFKPSGNQQRSGSIETNNMDTPYGKE